MEPHGSAAGQKCSKEPREKNSLQRKWVSEPCAGTKESSYAESLQSGISGTVIATSGKLLLSAESQSSAESQFFHRSYSYQLQHSYPHQPMQKPFLSGTKSQPGLEPHAWPFPGKLQSLPQDDVFSVHSRSHGAFPRQKSPSLPSAFCQYSQSGSEQKEEGHKKEQKPKKPGKYICQYCGRACAKPSVLKKHIRSHTGERPYPCEPCGFSFKTKSNLYKHRKSHAHAIKAGLVPFSELATRTDIDQASSVGETEVQSDADQSTDTDEENAEGATYPEKSSSIPQISFDSDKSTLDKGGEPAYADSAEEMAMTSMKVPILIVPKQGLTSTTIECTPFTEIRGSNMRGMVLGDESHTVKQRLALRLTDKKGQDSEQSLNLLSPHSKGSTDSGYFSRSESAEQQISPPNTNAKTYEEIMFGRSWYYRPISRSRHSVTIGMAATASPDPQNKSAMIEMDMGKISEDCVFFRETFPESQMVAVGEPKQYPRGYLLEAPCDTGPLLRSNSMPTPSPTNLNVPSALRVSQSFDEMMSPDEVFYPGAASLRRLRRQGAFEQGESDNYGKVGGQFSTIKMGDREQMMSEFKGSGSELACPDMRRMVGVSEMTTRKRRKEKSVGDEEDCPGQYDEMKNVSFESSGDYDLKQGSQETSVAAHTGRGSMYSGYSSLESFDRVSGMCPEDIVLVQDTDRKAAVNVISVIQHTNLLSRPNSFEKTESIEHQTYQPEKPFGQLSEQSDPENIDDVQSPDSILRAESMEHQQTDNELASVSPSQQYHMPHKLVRQPNIQVPEIRVTEEPDKPEKEPEVPTKEPEKHVEEFQWPQRSETLSQLPAEKLPPKKKRLRLADIEHSSGESSFESTCTSLSRSPSQESNLSSSFSMSFDREESMKSVSPTKQDDFSKQSEFLTVPGSGHSLSIPGHQKEMRRSSSEQSPSGLPIEVPEIRSKSFDYGSLSSNSRQGELYASASSMKERRRGYLVRQASLSVYPEVVPQEQCSELNIKQELSDTHALPSSWQGSSSLTASPHLVTGSDLARQKRGSYHLLQQSISEDSQSDDLQKSPRLPGQLSTDSEASVHEHMSQDVMQYSSHPSSISSPFFQTVVWYTDPTRPRQHQGIHQLQKIHIRPPNPQSNLQTSHQPLHQIQMHNESNTDGACQTYPYVSRTSPQTIGNSSKMLTSSSVFFQQVQPGFTQTVGPQSSLPGMLVPVRIQTNVPSYGSVMYTSVSQILSTHAQSTTSFRIGSDNTSTSSLKGISSKHPIGFSLSKILGHPEGSQQYPLWKAPEPLPGQLNTGIPLSLTSGTISTTDASASIGGSKRMLSPASSLELFIGTKQQKRIKEEKMYGQIVKELSAVELSNSRAPNDGDRSPQLDVLKRDDLGDDLERMSSSPPGNYPSSIFSSASDVPHKESFTPPLQIVMNTAKRAESPEELDVDKPNPEAPSDPESMISSSDTQDELKQTKIPVNMLVQLAASQGGAVCGSTLLLTDLADVDQFFQFPSLRTTASVSWCYLNYTKPNYAQTTPLTSVYGSWCVSSYNPNPLSLSTKATLALLCSKQRRNTETYTMAAMCQPGTGKLVSSLLWKQKFEQVKPELMKVDIGKMGKKIKGVISRDRVKEDHGEKETSSKQAEPTRIKIFEGGYKSNEDYVYVRGRGRGKYICEECGIRCKKPSMLKKHIRTHTDVRPYVCKFCNFAFKTKGNLTKHMKSKAHMKKCLELGVSVTCIDDVEGVDTAEEIQRDTGKIGMLEIMAEHQFSDADDSDGAEEDGDEVDEDEEDDDDYDGDSTPKTPSRSTSPHPYVISPHSVTAVAASHDTGPDPLGSAPKQPLFGYYTSLPTIQITQLMVPGEKARESQMAEYQKLLQGALGEDPKNRLEMPSSMDEDPGLSPEHSSSSFELSPSRLSSPSCDSSPLREPSPSCRYLSPKRDLSPRGRLSPRREASPLRPLSPRRDIYRKDLSPRRDMSPRGLLSPSSHAGCPVSSTRDLSCRRELSPRGRYKGVLRPLSPRRAPHPHSGPWTLNQHPHREMSQKSRSHSEININQRKSCYPQGDKQRTEAPATHQGLFSHLPLHSQQQVRTLFPMIPIGGIQIVPGLAHPARLPLKTNTSEESSDASFHFSDGCDSNNTQSAEDTAQPQDMAQSPKTVSSAPSPSSQRSRDGGKGLSNKESKQEEGIMTCTKAIASLCIASEEPLGKVAGSIQQIQQHTLSHSPNVQQESRHSTTETGMSATSKAPGGGCPPLYITGATERSPGQQGQSKNPSSTTNN
ncbi:transcription factor HIVEP2a [Tachysurus ichikawai]